MLVLIKKEELTSACSECSGESAELQCPWRPPRCPYKHIFRVWSFPNQGPALSFGRGLSIWTPVTLNTRTCICSSAVSDHPLQEVMTFVSYWKCSLANNLYFSCLLNTLCFSLSLCRGSRQLSNSQPIPLPCVHWSPFQWLSHLTSKGISFIGTFSKATPSDSWAVGLTFLLQELSLNYIPLWLRSYWTAGWWTGRSFPNLILPPDLFF